MNNIEKPPRHIAAEQAGAVIEMYSAPAVHAYLAWIRLEFDVFRTSLPQTALSSFGKEKQ